MKYCPICEKTYGDEVGVCEVDGSVLRDSIAAQVSLAGKTIKGRYQVTEKLGEGGMAVVYLAEQVNIGRKVALKILHGQYAGDQEFVKRFRQEARLAASLNHPNVIKVYDFDQADDGSLFIAMEYLQGKNLKEVIQAGPVDIGKAIRLATQIADGLVVAHRSGVIHRDIKPENIMVVGGEEIKLMDFGIARLRESGGATRLTRAGMIMGTPLYMAPEQIEGSEVTEKTDIYAFGIVLYEMLSGRAPFKAPTPAAVLMKHLKEIPLPLRKLRGEVPASVEKVVFQALEKKPERRQANMADIAESLRSIEAKLSRDEVAKTLMITQPLEVIDYEGEEQRRSFGKLFAKVKDSGALLLQRLTSIKRDRKSQGSEEVSRTPANLASGRTMAETLVLTQTVSVPQKKKIHRIWMGVSGAVLLLVVLGLFLRSTVVEPAKDRATSDNPVAQSKQEPASSEKARIVTATIGAERQELAVGERANLTLRARYADGRQEDVTEGIEWRSSDTAVLEIGAGGELMGRRGGKAMVTARLGEVEAAPLNFTVRELLAPTAPVAEARLVSLTIQGKREINVRERFTLRAKARYSDGTENALKKDVRWESSDRSVVAVNSRGEVEGRKEGRAEITARYGEAVSEPLWVVVKVAPRPEESTGKVQKAGPSETDIRERVNVARSYRDRGAYSQAIEELERARQIDPNNREIQEEIAATRRACSAERKLGLTEIKC
jgi:serine/threonine protein kinase